MIQKISNPATLHVVATPIGNLEDISPRAITILQSVDLIAAEDTRHSGKLLKTLGIDTPMTSYHDHNQTSKTPVLIAKLQSGSDLALISDAGTPLISDPGYRLVRAAQDAGIRVLSIAGPSAVIAALAVSGLATDRFTFEGFLPSKATARKNALRELANEPRTLVFYESPHRVYECVLDMLAIFGADRELCLARELSKRYETTLRSTIGGILELLDQDPNQQRGELVLVLAGAEQKPIEGQAEQVLKILMDELPLKQAASLTAGITGESKNHLYELGLKVKG